MDTLIQQLINGLTIGSFYALVALGYSMVYGVMKLINFAHGDLFTLGSYIGYTILVVSASWVTATFGIWGGMAIALVAAMIGIGVAGLVMERIAYRPVYKAGRLPLVVSALGMSFVISQGIMAIWGPNPQAYLSGWTPKDFLQFGEIRVPILQIAILLLALGLMALIYWLVERTTFGAAIRAAAQDRDTATLMGINFNLIIFFVFALGPALGGMAGVMQGLKYTRISFDMGWMYGLKAFTATILGGIGNIPGAMIGGLLLGVMEALFEGYVSGAWKDVFIFLVLILVLIWRPTGLFGEKTAEKV